MFDEIEEALRRANASSYGSQPLVAIHRADSMRTYEGGNQVHTGMLQVSESVNSEV